jgi:hypothetical protein
MTKDDGSSKWQGGHGWYYGKRHGAGSKRTDRTAPRNGANEGTHQVSASAHQHTDQATAGDEPLMVMD